MARAPFPDPNGMNSLHIIRGSAAVALVGLSALAGCAAKPKAAKPAAPPAAAAPAPARRPAVARTGSLYDRLGGEEVIRKVVDDFVSRASTDRAVNFARKGHATTWEPTPQNVERLKERLVQYVATTANGPSKHQYRGRDMVSAHRGMGITPAEFDALAGHLLAALEANDVPRRECEELMAAVASTRAAIVESTGAPTAAPIASAPGEPAVTDSQPAEADPEAPQATVPQDEVAPEATTPDVTTPAEPGGEEPTQPESQEPRGEQPQADAPAVDEKPAEAAPAEQEAEAPEYSDDEPR
jgi:hemoglobin